MAGVTLSMVVFEYPRIHCFGYVGPIQHMDVSLRIEKSAGNASAWIDSNMFLSKSFNIRSFQLPLTAKGPRKKLHHENKLR